MATQLQLRRGNTTQNDSFRGAAGEITIDTNDETIRLHNGTSTGGKRIRPMDVTNCIINLPQDIKASIQTISSTVKVVIQSGSKGYYPNGSNTFTSFTLTADESNVNYSSTADGEYYLYRRNASGTSGYFGVKVSEVKSGTSVTSSTTGFVFYNTTDNRIDWYDANSTARQDRLYSFPVAKVTISNGAPVYVEPINGMGFVGRVFYVLPGLKALHANGFYDDGSLKNDITTVSAVKIYSGGTSNQWGQLILNKNGGSCQFAGAKKLWVYKKSRNKFVYWSNKDESWIDIGSYWYSSSLGYITEFKPNYAINVADSNKVEDYVNKYDDQTISGSNVFSAGNTFNGNNTFNGTNTFTSEPKFTGGNLNIFHTDVTKGTTPTANKYWGLEATANPANPSDTSWQSRRLGKLEWCLTDSNITSATLSAIKNEGTSTTSASIGVYYDTANNYAYTYAPTKSITTNDTNIATTKSVMDVLKTIYPVGSIYMGTQSTCPLASLFGTWTRVPSGYAIWTGNGTGNTNASTPNGTTTNANYANANPNTTIAAGLPDIIGSVGSSSAWDNNQNFAYATGAFATEQNLYGRQSAHGEGGGNRGFNMYASRSSSVYGQSSTAQPPAYVVNVWRRTA